MTAIDLPAATSGATALADYLELRAFRAADRNSSIQDLIQAIRRSGTSEEFGDSGLDDADDPDPIDRGGTKSEACANEAFAEVEDRHSACNGDGAYPFEIAERTLQLGNQSEKAVYTFLLLLSRYGLRAGPAGSHPERLFEDVCRAAAENYLGGQSLGGRALHFGFPRRILPRAFPAALHELTKQLGDGSANGSAPKSKEQKDAKLDIVAWKEFPDGRRGKLIAYGQCAVGQSDWKDKVHELQPGSFHKKWLREHPVVDPIRMFFVPFRVERADWCDLCIDAGVLFDRCRIAAYAGELAKDLKRECVAWSRFVLKEKVRQ